MTIRSWLKSILTPHPEYFTMVGSEMVDPKDAALYEAVRSQIPNEEIAKPDEATSNSKA